MKRKCKTKKKPQNTTIKKHRSRSGGTSYLHSSQIHSDRRYQIVLAETYDTGLFHKIYIGKAKKIHPIQTCGGHQHESMCESSPSPPRFFPDGKGTLITFGEDGEYFTCYEGNFVNGERSGKGKNSYFRSGELLEEINQIRTMDDVQSVTPDQWTTIIDAWKRAPYLPYAVYDGHWANNHMSGYGTMTSQNGVYMGNWRNDLKDGVGKMTYVNGDVYFGQWKNNRKHGKGIMTYAHGPVASYNGDWKEDKMDGLANVTRRADGVTRSVIMSNNQRVQSRIASTS
jgi:hypothetical protein